MHLARIMGLRCILVSYPLVAPGQKLFMERRYAACCAKSSHRCS